MNLATQFTLSRIVIAPFFAYAFIHGFNHNSTIYIWLAVICAIGIELSDLFDGLIARSRGEVTDFGKVFDPVADSLSRQTVFLSFMITGIIPLWMYLIFFYRDAFLQLLRIVCASNGVVLAARKSGKFKAVVQGVATFLVLAVVLADQYKLGFIPAKILSFHPGFWIMTIPAAITLLSVIDYVIPNGHLLKKMMEPKKK
jgi:CDP-diacylglycerol--glycerol-3-phosphate 3-phosphatidyltransferase